MITRTAVALALMCSASVAAQDMVLRGGTLVDPATGRTTPDTVVVVRDGRIAQVGTARSIKAPAGLPVVDAQGKRIVPGYIDGHVHFHQSGGLYTRPDAVDQAVRDLLLRTAGEGSRPVRTRPSLSPVDQASLEERHRVDGAAVRAHLEVKMAGR